MTKIIKLKKYEKLLFTFDTDDTSRIEKFKEKIDRAIERSSYIMVPDFCVRVIKMKAKKRKKWECVF